MDPMTLMALTGLGGNLLGGFFQSQASKDMAQAQQNAIAQQMAERQRAYEDVTGLYEPYKQIGDVALGDLQNLAYDESQYQMPDEFQFQGQVEDYLDPSMDYQMQRMQDATQQSAVAQGGLLSGNTLKALQDRGAQMAQTDYGNAFNRMQTEKQNAYKQYTDRFAQQRQMNALRYQRMADMANLGTNATANMAGARTGLSNQQTALMGQQGDVNAFQATIPWTQASQATQALTNPALMNMAGQYMQGSPQAMAPTQQPQFTQNSGAFQLPSMNLTRNIPQGNL